MKLDRKSKIPEILAQYETDLLRSWIEAQRSTARGRGPAEETALRELCAQFMQALRDACKHGNLTDTSGPEWDSVREVLADISRSRAKQDYSPVETASFVFSLKRPLFAHLRDALGNDDKAFAAEIWVASELLDSLGLYTIEVYQHGREEVILRQQQDVLELSTPVVKLWDGILAVPLIGTLDSARTQVVMETLLQRIVDTSAQIAIIDITGVPTVDTLVAQHLLKTVAATRLMGAECIISGIRPQIAQTIVHLGVELGEVASKPSLADALALALQRVGIRAAHAAGPQESLT